MMRHIILFSIFISTLLYSHGGRTNSEGCHNQRGGSYHCHGKKAKKKKSSRKKHSSKAQKSQGTYNCQRKYCKYMVNCKEAYYKLNTCGHSSLDRDRDGVPCENICSGG